MLINSSIYLSKMQKITIKAWLVILLIGIAPSYSQSKQVNAPQEKPFYATEIFVSTVLSGIAIAFLGYIGGMVIGGTKTISQAEKDKFKRDFLKEDIIPLIDEKIAANEQIKGLQLEVILTRIENNIEKLSAEIHGMYSSQEIEKQSVIRRFDEVNLKLSHQQRNTEKLVERLNQTLQNAFGEYGAAVPTIQIRGSRNPRPQSYETDGGNIK